MFSIRKTLSGASLEVASTTLSSSSSPVARASILARSIHKVNKRVRAAMHLAAPASLSAKFEVASVEDVTVSSSPVATTVSTPTGTNTAVIEASITTLLDATAAAPSEVDESDVVSSVTAEEDFSLCPFELFWYVRRVSPLLSPLIRITDLL